MTFLLLFLMHLILYYTFVIHQALIPVLSPMDCVAICVFLSHMEVTSAHARQALHLSLMEKPVIMVRFKQGEAGSRGQGGAGTKQNFVYLDNRYAKKVPGAIVVLPSTDLRK